MITDNRLSELEKALARPLPDPLDPKGEAGSLKCPLHLIPPVAMDLTAWVHKHGGKKYGEYNWRKSKVCVTTYVAAIMRHLNAFRDGENDDPESGLPHLAHIGASVNILLDAQACGTLVDDRSIKPQSEKQDENSTH